MPEQSTFARSEIAIVTAILRFCWPANRSRSDSIAQENSTSKRLWMATFAARRLVGRDGVEPSTTGL
ncbi:MAG: hypothetical protein Greene041662_182 [Candidatus Peregrinibacteria bacterium Greene0416_62]|nr:MAG: hypothetical protein Greene041662_182 [Candidatus Peregrinibacteria bacterium Greene0416_62]TSC99593.1 MAG: hypothetical protein Greene101449_590 [Candidatus Peregrinibacteria bacterium Greene1014_49]